VKIRVHPWPKTSAHLRLCGQSLLHLNLFRLRNKRPWIIPAPIAGKSVFSRLCAFDTYKNEAMARAKTGSKCETLNVPSLAGLNFLSTTPLP
jgi:hypothetical protein